MIWFMVGAGLGCLQLAFYVVFRGLRGRQVITGLLFSIVLGAAVYGTVLWLLSKVF